MVAQMLCSAHVLEHVHDGMHPSRSHVRYILFFSLTHTSNKDTSLNSYSNMQGLSDTHRREHRPFFSTSQAPVRLLMHI